MTLQRVFRGKLPCRFLTIAFIALLGIPCLAGGSTVREQAKPQKGATRSERWKGNIATSTHEQGLWTFVTVDARDEGQPLQVALVLQHLPPVPAPMNLTFSGSAELFGRQLLPPGSALLLRSDEGGCWFLRLKDYQGQVPNRCVVVDLAGIARYESTPGHNSLPATHKDFVDQLLPTLKKEGPRLTPGGQALETAPTAPTVARVPTSAPVRPSRPLPAPLSTARFTVMAATIPAATRHASAASQACLPARPASTRRRKLARYRSPERTAYADLLRLPQRGACTKTDPSLRRERTRGASTMSKKRNHGERTTKR